MTVTEDEAIRIRRASQPSWEAHMFARYNDIRARRARGEEGFSLIELLVVVVIMGILIAIAVPVYLNYQNGAKKKSLEADVRNAIPTVEQCMADNNGTFVAACGGTFTPSASGTAPYIFRVSEGNQVIVASATNGYTISGSRTAAPSPYTVTYTSATGATVKSDTAAPGDDD